MTALDSTRLRPLRILRVIHSVNPADGGPIEGIKQVSAVLRNMGCSVDIASLDAPDAPWVRECPIVTHALGPGRGGYGYSPGLVPWLKEHRQSYDAVVVSGLWQYSGFGTWRASRADGAPYFVFPHGMLDPWFKRTYPLKHLKKWLYWPWGEYRVLRDAEAVLFTCEEERRLARQSFWLYKCHEKVVNYGTASPGGDPNKQRLEFWARHSALKGRRLVLFLSRIHEKKAVDVLLQAWAKFMSLHGATASDLCLVIAGPCADEAYLDSLKTMAHSLGMENSVVWTGPLYQDLKWGALHAADAFILPSHQENFGIAVVEALACGLPVLISDKVNIHREVTADGGGLAAKDTVGGVVQLLTQWFQMDEAQKKAMRVNAHACFEKRFEIHQAAANLLEVLQPKS